jgi:hypothetical protein
MTAAALLRQLADTINSGYRRGHLTISAAPVDLAGVPGVNLFDHTGRGRPRPLDTVWHVAAGQPVPSGTGRTRTALFVWGPAYNWTAPTSDIPSAVTAVARTAGCWPGQTRPPARQAGSR